jgi:broad specificity phosphatase PhoE
VTRRGALAVACGLVAALAAFPAAAGDALADLQAPAAGTLRVYFVRHGQALSNLDPKPALSEEQLDHLTELGQRQAEAAARALAGRGASAVYTSPAVRAIETSSAVTRALGLEAPVLEPRLRPMAVGQAANGRELEWSARIAEWRAGRDPSPPGGESMEAVGDRVSAFVRSLAEGSRGASVVLVAHSEVIGAYLGRVRGTSPSKRYPPGLGNGSISVVDVAAGTETVALANHVPAQP